MTRMTDEELKQARRVADALNADGTSTVHRLLAHIAAVTAKRDEARKETPVVRSYESAEKSWREELACERDALRERVRALEAENEARCAEMNAVRQRAVVLRAMNLRDVMSGEWNREAAWLVHFILGDEVGPSAPPEAFTHEKGLDAGVFDDAPHEFPCCGGSDEHPPQHTQDCSGSAPTASEAFALVREDVAWLERQVLATNTANRIRECLSLLERRMGALWRLAEPQVPCTSCGAPHSDHGADGARMKKYKGSDGTQLCHGPAVCMGFTSALTDAPVVFTRGEVDWALDEAGVDTKRRFAVLERLTALWRKP